MPLFVCRKKRIKENAQHQNQLRIVIRKGQKVNSGLGHLMGKKGPMNQKQITNNSQLGKEQAMKKLTIVIFLVISLALGGCAGMSDTEQRTLSGGAIGAGAGAVVGAIAGHTGLGLAVGAAAGLAGGYLYDHHEKAQQKAHDQAYDQGYEAGKKNQ
jgi:hypothetical protein